MEGDLRDLRGGDVPECLGPDDWTAGQAPGAAVRASEGDDADPVTPGQILVRAQLVAGDRPRLQQVAHRRHEHGDGHVHGRVVAHLLAAPGDLVGELSPELFEKLVLDHGGTVLTRGGIKQIIASGHKPP